MSTILASVGLGGENRRQDVIVVQSLLQTVGVSPGPIDGRCGQRTIGAIERFQRGLIRRPDGRIDVRGPTMRQLAARTARVRSQPQKQPGPADRKNVAVRLRDPSTQKPSVIAPNQSIEAPLTRTMAYVAGTHTIARSVDKHGPYLPKQRATHRADRRPS